MCIACHVHSEYSALDGWSKISEIADRAEKLDMPSIALTDHGVVSGHLEFDKVMRKRGIKPIFGIEAYQGTKTEFKGKERDAHHLIILAETDEGLKNLWRLVDATASEDHFRYVGRMFKEDIAKHKDGLIFTSACALGLVPKQAIQGDYDWLNWYMDTLGDNFFIELSTYPGDKGFEDDEDEEPLNTRIINEALVEVGLERGCEFIYGDDSHYADPDQFDLHDAYLAVKTKQSVFTPVEERKMWHPEGALAIKSEADVRAALSYLPETVVDNAIENSHRVAERCNATLPGVERRLPVFIPKECPWLERYDIESDDVAQVFIELVEQGIIRRYGKDAAPEIWKRAVMEMEVFLESGLEHYFLLAWDLGEFCDHPRDFWDENEDRLFRHVEDHEPFPDSVIERGPGRGSAAGCIVAYALGITDADPLHYDLYFERFWNPGRAKGFPDIDSDFQRKRRREIREYLKARWGADRVRSIGTITRMKPKAAIDRMWVGCGVTFEEKEKLKKIVSDTPDIDILGPDQIGWNPEIEPGKVIYVKNSVGKEIDEWVATLHPDRRAVMEVFLWILENVCNRVENYGIHASGIVVSPVDLPDVAPSYLRGPKDDRVAATLYPMDAIDGLQLVKLDVLGLKTLDTLDDWRSQMKNTHGIDIQWSGLDKDEYPEEMWQLLDDGFSAGIFQIEGGYASHIAKELKPRSIEDLSIIVALNRPGPIRSGAPDSFIVRRNGGTDDKFDGRKIPILKDILEPTYGWFLYQEQVIQFFNAMDYTLSESDVVRKILGKKQPEKWDELLMGTGEWALETIDTDEGEALHFKKLDPLTEQVVDAITIKSRGYAWMAREAGLDEKQSFTIWKMLVEFGKYSFNKSHSICYGIIAFRTLFAKYYGPSEFYMSCIRTVDKNKKAELMPAYINEARRKNINVLPPHILHSKADIDVYQGDVIFGFSNIKGVARAADFIVELRDDLGVDCTTPESMFEQLNELNDAFLKAKKQAAKDGNPFEKKVKSPKQKLGENQIQMLWDSGCWDDLIGRDITMREKQQYEKEFLEVILTDDSEQILMNNYEAVAECDEYSDAQIPWDGEDTGHVLCGIITNIKETKTKKDKKPMGIVTIEYSGDLVDFVVFPQQWKAYKFLFKERNVGIFGLRHTDRGINFEEGRLLS